MECWGRKLPLFRTLPCHAAFAKVAIAQDTSLPCCFSDHAEQNTGKSPPKTGDFPEPLATCNQDVKVWYHARTEESYSLALVLCCGCLLIIGGSITKGSSVGGLCWFPEDQLSGTHSWMGQGVPTPRLSRQRAVAVWKRTHCKLWGPLLPSPWKHFQGECIASKKGSHYESNLNLNENQQTSDCKSRFAYTIF